MVISPNSYRSPGPRRDFTFEKKRYPRRTKVHWGRFLIVILLFMCLLGAMLGIFVSSLIGKFSVLEIFLSLVPSEALIGKTNILLMGIDATDGVRRSDMLMVVHVDPERGAVGALSIPRDSIVVIPGRGMDKINHAYAYGGTDLAIQTVSNLLNVPIDFYVKIEVDSLVKMIDQLGGVTVNVDQRMYYSDYAGNLFVDLQPGKQKLTGREAMGFVRFRHDAKGDIGRISRQQSFIQSLGNELSAPQNMSKLFWLLREFTSTVETSLSSRQILGLASELRRANDMGAVVMDTVPGYPEMINGVSYIRPDASKIRYVINRTLINPVVPAKKIKGSKNNYSN